MSAFSRFITHHVIAALERELIAHAPQLQEAFLHEIKELLEALFEWLKKKLDHIQEKKFEDKKLIEPPQF